MTAYLTPGVFLRPESVRKRPDSNEVSSPHEPFSPDTSKNVAYSRSQLLMAKLLGEHAHRALVVEASLTPKPGLVDSRNTGSHADMSLETFINSAESLRPHLGTFVRIGIMTARDPLSHAFAELRREGLSAESSMLDATNGVNTHKGAIFAFGLILGAAGRSFANWESLTPDSICELVAQMTGGLVDQELRSANRTATTAGELVFARYGLSGARGEAQSGFSLVRSRALPIYLAEKTRSGDGETALLAAMLELLAYNRDTNLVARGGLDGIFHVRRWARNLRRNGGTTRPDFREDLIAMDDDLIRRNLSPGGSADLIAVSWFLGEIDQVTRQFQSGIAERIPISR